MSRYWLVSLLLCAGVAQAQQFSSAPDPAASLTEAQRQEVRKMFRKSDELLRQMTQEREQRMQLISQRWDGEPLYNEIVNHPNCKGFKDRVVAVSKGRPYSHEVAFALESIRHQARNSGCIPQPVYQQPRR